MKRQYILASIAIVWLLIVFWIINNKLTAHREAMSKPLIIYSQDDTEMGELFDLNQSDNAQKNARLIETVRDLLINNLDEPIGGLKTWMTIDSELQRTANRLVNENLAAKPSLKDIGVVVLDNKTGAILASIGGRLPADFSAKDNLVNNSKFRVGAMIIPLVYSVAVDKKGLQSGAKIKVGNQLVSANESLVSLDIDAAKTLGAQVGKTRLHNLMSDHYFNSSPSLTIDKIVQGDFEATLIVLTSAYSALGAKGKNFNPYLLERIETFGPETLFTNKPRSKQAFKPGTAVMLSKMLKPENNLYLVSAENWCIGFTDKVTIGIVAVDGSVEVKPTLRKICKELEKVAAQRGWNSNELK